ncbi:MAG: GyrI-like domain-containing protein [Thermoplasmata archaeon]|nr:GyrI-like domain-containing protein [Thermoplasmata archaeon]
MTLELDIRIRNVGPLRVALVEGKGLPYSETMPAAFDRLMRWFDGNGALLPRRPPLGIALYVDAPGEVPPEETRFVVAIPTDSGAASTEDIRIEVLPGYLAAVATFHGPYSRLHEVYVAMFDWLEENGYRMTDTPRDWYMNDCTAVPPGACITEVHFPIGHQGDIGPYVPGDDGELDPSASDRSAG